MLDEKSNSRFWNVTASLIDGSEKGFIMQSCHTKDAEYIKRILTEIHPEYEDITVVATTRPNFVKHAYGDAE